MCASLNLFIVANFAQTETKKESPLRKIYQHLNRHNQSIIKYADLIDFRNLGLTLQATCYAPKEEIITHLKSNPNTSKCEILGQDLLAEMNFKEKETFESFLEKFEHEFSLQNKSRFNRVMDIKNEEFLCKEV